MSEHRYATLLVMLNDPSATPFPVSLQTLLPLHVDRSTQSLQVSVTIPSNKTTMWDSQIHLMFPLNCQLLFTTSMSVPSLLWTTQVQRHGVTTLLTYPLRPQWDIRLQQQCSSTGLYSLVAFLATASVGSLVSMLRSSIAGGGRRVHLAEGGSGLHRSAQPIYRTVRVRL